MSKDLQLIAVQDTIPVLFLQYVAGAAVPTLELKGRDFRNVSEVFINGSPSPSFIVMSDTRMLAQVPNSQTGASIDRVLVLSSTFTRTERSVIRFRLSPLSKGISGIEKLVQLFIRTFFTTPGRNIFNKADGGGALSLVGKVAGQYQQSELTGGFARSVDSTTSQILAAQSSMQGLPPDERLAAADLQGVDFDHNTGTVAGRVKITSAAGQSALANVFPEQDDS